MVFVSSLFSSRRATLELYLLLLFCTRGAKSRLVDELDKLLLDHRQTRTVVAIHLGSTACLPGRWRGGRSSGYGARRSAGTMGHGPFHCLAPFDLSSAHGCHH